MKKILLLVGVVAAAVWGARKFMSKSEPEIDEFAPSEPYAPTDEYKPVDPYTPSEPTPAV